MIDSTIQYATTNPLTTLTLLVSLSCLLYILLTELHRHSARLPGFPGPPGLPVIGNLHQIRLNAAEQYRLWSHTYGPVYQIMLGNIPVLVVNSAQSAKDIFGSNSQALASRPEFYTFHRVVSSTAGTTIGTSPFSESLKRRRKGAASALNKPSVQSYLPHIDLETRDFLAELLTDGAGGSNPVDPLPSIQRLSLSLALTLNWGTRMRSRQNELFNEITYVEEEVSKFRSTTGNLQDYIPLLRLNPFSFGSKHARDMRHRRDVYLQKLNRELDDRMAKGTHSPCIQANILSDAETRLNAEELTSISLTMLSGGLDTLTTLVAWAIALLASRPDIQTQAYNAIREVYPSDIPIPPVEPDLNSIPYIAALSREFLRYYTPLRLSLPRATIKPFTYNNATVPTGTVIFLNAHACNNDPQVWDDPEVFRPERWLEQPDAPLFTYGLGYRMCAGSLLANRELFAIWLRLLSAFEIVGVQGEKEVVETHPVKGVEDQTQLVSVPRRYRVRFVPRNERRLTGALDVTEGEEKEKVES